MIGSAESACLATSEDGFEELRAAITNPNPPMSSYGKLSSFGLFLGPRRVILGRQLFGFAAAQLAHEILFRFKRPAGELALVAMIGRFIRTPMAAIAVDDSCVRCAGTAEPKENPEQQQSLKADAMTSFHVRQ